MFMLSRDRDMFQMIVILNDIFSSKFFLSIKCIFILTTCTSVQSKHMHNVFVFLTYYFVPFHTKVLFNHHLNHYQRKENW